MNFDKLQDDPGFRSWIERLIEDKIGDELRKHEARRFLESFALISVRPKDPLAAAIAKHLGKPLVDAELLTFGDGEKKTVIKENLRGKHAFVIATVGDGEDPDVSLANTCKYIATLHRTCKVANINLVVPCLWYQAQDKTHARREPITVRDIADDLLRRGMNHVMVIELHAEQIEIAFDSFDHMKMAPLFADYIEQRFGQEEQGLVLISPDDGGVRAREELHKNLSTQLIAGQASVHQLRKRKSVDEKELLDFVGEVEGKTGLILDDMMRSGTTMFQAASAAKKAGARRVVGIATHFYGIDSSTQGSFEQRLLDSDLDELIVSNTRPYVAESVQRSAALQSKMTVLDVSLYLARAIRNYESGGTIKDMLGRLRDKRELYDVLHEAASAKH